MKITGLDLSKFKTEKDIISALLVLDLLLRHTTIINYGNNGICELGEQKTISCDIFKDKLQLSTWLNNAWCRNTEKGIKDYEHIDFIYKFCKKYDYKVVKTEEEKQKAWDCLSQVVKQVADDFRKGEK